jgi:hypothetical protein
MFAFMSLQGGTDRRRRVTNEVERWLLIRCRNSQEGPKATISEGPIRQSFPRGREEFPDKSGKRGDGLSGLMVSVGAEPMS